MLIGKVMLKYERTKDSVPCTNGRRYNFSYDTAIVNLYVLTLPLVFRP